MNSFFSFGFFWIFVAFTGLFLQLCVHISLFLLRINHSEFVLAKVRRPLWLKYIYYVYDEVLLFRPNTPIELEP